MTFRSLSFILGTGRSWTNRSKWTRESCERLTLSRSVSRSFASWTMQHTPPSVLPSQKRKYIERTKGVASRVEREMSLSDSRRALARWSNETRERNDSFQRVIVKWLDPSLIMLNYQSHDCRFVNQSSLNLTDRLGCSVTNIFTCLL
jgi:hypothetical protein